MLSHLPSLPLFPMLSHHSTSPILTRTQRRVRWLFQCAAWVQLKFGLEIIIIAYEKHFSGLQQKKKEENQARNKTKRDNNNSSENFYPHQLVLGAFKSTLYAARSA